MKHYIFKAQFVFVTLLVSICFMACNKGGECAYDTPCIDTCIAYENFEDSTIGNSGNWMGILDGGISFEMRGGSTALKALDASGSSYVYNNADFPKDLIAAGCELVYDVEYLAGSSNLIQTNNSIIIYQGSNPVLATLSASFILNTSSMITSGSPPATVHVPLELATGTTLPSNSYGQWALSGVLTPTATDIANFNTLIQSISGISFYLDEGSNPAEEWWYDNFCFRQCCPQQNNQ